MGRFQGKGLPTLESEALAAYCFNWLRGHDLNVRPSGYEPDELPDCSTPRNYLKRITTERQTSASDMRAHRPRFVSSFSCLQTNFPRGMLAFIAEMIQKSSHFGGRKIALIA
jgi:hypothetical protein